MSTDVNTTRLSLSGRMFSTRYKSAVTGFLTFGRVFGDNEGRSGPWDPVSVAASPVVRNSAAVLFKQRKGASWPWPPLELGGISAEWVESVRVNRSHFPSCGNPTLCFCSANKKRKQRCVWLLSRWVGESVAPMTLDVIDVGRPPSTTHVGRSI